MHELSIATSVMNDVCDVASKNNVKSVNKIYLVVGSSSAIIKEALIEAFCALQLLAEYKLCSNAKIAVKELVSKSICLDCGCQYKHGVGAGQCPKCSSYNTQVTEGTNIYIDKIEVTE